jgi:hypothetical protein
MQAKRYMGRVINAFRLPGAGETASRWSQEASRWLQGGPISASIVPRWLPDGSWMAPRGNQKPYRDRVMFFGCHGLVEQKSEASER